MGARDGLRISAEQVLQNLTVEDARDAFAAIALANPGGLGRAGEADVREPPAITLLEAMRLAQHRDRIAWNYTHAFPDVFRRGRPLLLALEARGWPPGWAVSGLFMALLARLPDSHVARRQGPAAALALRRRVRPLARRLLAAGRPADLADELLALDAALKQERINPGTTADLVVASCFALRLAGRGATPTALLDP